ncbi:MAG: NUDIX hydrolase [Verrucomicrobiaceae bacterium]|nr:MAG: NUDIX hydrolase [Verrucomicrobiaceae bacterium]
MWRTRLCLVLAFLNLFAFAALAGVGGPAGIVLYHRSGEEVFLLLADHQPPSTRGWGAFGGSYEEGETPAQTAARETEEETRGYFKRVELLNKIKDQTPFEDGVFSLFFLEVDHVPAEQIAGGKIPEGDNSYRERGPWAWVPFSEILRHLKTEPHPQAAAILDSRLLPAGVASKHYWPVWLHNMHRALNAGALPWIKVKTGNEKAAKVESTAVLAP